MCVCVGKGKHKFTRPRGDIILNWVLGVGRWARCPTDGICGIASARCNDAADGCSKFGRAGITFFGGLMCGIASVCMCGDLYGCVLCSVRMVLS